VAFLRERPTIATAKACLERIHRLVQLRHGWARGSDQSNHIFVNTRVFLAAFLIVGWPTRVFESMDDLETKLLESATALLASFEQIVSEITKVKVFKNVPYSITRPFHTLLMDYLRDFQAWKAPDEAKLITRITHALIALYQADQSLPPDEPANSKLKMEFKSQIERLRCKLRQISGSAMVEQFDEKRATLCAGQPLPWGLSTCRVLATEVTNEQLAHELLLNSAFQLTESNAKKLAQSTWHHVQMAFHESFFDSLTDDLKLTPPCLNRAFRLLIEVRDRIADVAGTDSPAHVEIMEIIDPAKLRQEQEAGACDWDFSVRLVSSIIRVIVSIQTRERELETGCTWERIREQMVEATREARPEALCKAFRFLMERVRVLGIDGANVR
jgi:hypothetical protein